MSGRVHNISRCPVSTITKYGGCGHEPSAVADNEGIDGYFPDVDPVVCDAIDACCGSGGPCFGEQADHRHGWLGIRPDRSMGICTKQRDPELSELAPAYP